MRARGRSVCRRASQQTIAPVPGPDPPTPSDFNLLSCNPPATAGSDTLQPAAAAVDPVLLARALGIVALCGHARQVRRALFLSRDTLGDPQLRMAVVRLDWADAAYQDRMDRLVARPLMLLLAAAPFAPPVQRLSGALPFGDEDVDPDANMYFPRTRLTFCAVHGAPPDAVRALLADGAVPRSDGRRPQPQTQPEPEPDFLGTRARPPQPTGREVGVLALCVAAYRGHVAVLQTLLSSFPAGAGVDPNGLCPAPYPTRLGIPPPSTEGGTRLHQVLSPLVCAVEGGSAECVRALLEAGADPDVCLSHLRPVDVEAILLYQQRRGPAEGGGSAECSLVQRGAATPLQRAVHNRSVDIVRLLLASIRQRTAEGSRGPLLAASQLAAEAVEAEAQTSAGFRVEDRRWLYRTWEQGWANRKIATAAGKHARNDLPPLLLACALGFPDLVDALLLHGDAPSAAPLDYTLGLPSSRSLGPLTLLTPPDTWSLVTPLVLAARLPGAHQATPIIRSLAAAGADQAALVRVRMTHHSSIDLDTGLLSFYPSTNLLGEWELGPEETYAPTCVGLVSALGVACMAAAATGQRRGPAEVGDKEGNGAVVTLLEAGADPDDAPSVASACVLIGEDADVEDAGDADGAPPRWHQRPAPVVIHVRPLVMAVAAASLDAVRALLSAGADPDTCVWGADTERRFGRRRTGKGEATGPPAPAAGVRVRTVHAPTVLMVAAGSLGPVMVRTLLAAGADPCLAVAKTGRDALHVALSRAEWDIAAVLLDAIEERVRAARVAGLPSPFDPSAACAPACEGERWSSHRPRGPTTYLHKAASAPDSERGAGIAGHEPTLVARLLALGADPGARSPLTGRTPLHVAAVEGRVAAIVALVRSGASTRTRDKTGATPAALARGSGKPEEVLLRIMAALYKTVVAADGWKEAEDEVVGGGAQQKVAAARPAAAVVRKGLYQAGQQRVVVAGSAAAPPPLPPPHPQRKAPVGSGGRG